MMYHQLSQQQGVIRRGVGRGTPVHTSEVGLDAAELSVLWKPELHVARLLLAAEHVTEAAFVTAVQAARQR